MRLAAQMFTVREFTRTPAEPAKAREQDRCDGDPFDSLKRSCENLREMGLE